MATNQEVKLEPKTVLMIVGVVILVGLAVWQATRSFGAASQDTSFTTKMQAPPDSARPDGMSGDPSSDKQ